MASDPDEEITIPPKTFSVVLEMTREEANTSILPSTTIALVLR